MVLPLFASLLRIDRRLLDAGASLGATPLSAFARIYLPLSLPGILAGTVLVFVNSLGFYITPALLGSPRQTLLSPLIITQTQLVLAWGRGGAMAMVLLVTTLALLSLGAVSARRALRRSGL
jgi:putative spermidine/putrescine transport system permease protein